MKKSLSILLLASTLSSASAFAGECETLFNHIDAWLEGPGNLVRVVTTMSSADNKVAYTRGFLEKHETIENYYLIESAYYSSESGNVDNPLAPTQIDAPLSMFKSDTDDMQFNYIVKEPVNLSHGLNATCRGQILHGVSDLGVLAVSFRFSTI